jgi:molybdate/tungstate transport system substrate-binding protein
VTRRAALAGGVAGLAGLAGCVGTLGGGPTPVSLLAAGSLNDALEHGLRPRVDAPLRVEARGSAAVARLVAEGQKDPDVVSLADVALFDGPLRPDWVAEFATNSLVVAYDPDGPGGRRVAEAGADGWYRALLRDDVALGRTDPDLDPLGYRTLFALDLAADHYGTDADLRAAIPRRDQVYPETQLIGQFETGAVDAAVTYRSMAVARGYDHVDLPPEVNLGDPAMADRYATTAYELPTGRVVRGAPVRYGSTVRRRSPTVDRVFRAHVTGDYLTDFGFGVPTDYPRLTGDAPDGIAG